MTLGFLYSFFGVVGYYNGLTFLYHSNLFGGLANGTSPPYDWIIINIIFMIMLIIENHSFYNYPARKPKHDNALLSMPLYPFNNLDHIKYCLK